MFCSGHDVFVVAEIGSNHNNREDMLMKLIDAAWEAGADAVKFQTHFYGDIASSKISSFEYGNADYVIGFESWNDVLLSFSLSMEMHKKAYNYARSLGLIPFSTPEGLEAVDFLESLETPIYKISSMDIDYLDLIKKIAQTGKPLIFSDGMADFSEVALTYEYIKTISKAPVGLLYCVSEYPSDFNNINFEIMKKYIINYPEICVGFSDHSLGIEAAIAAVAIGAKIIEKHITLDRKLPGPDHCFSMDPREFKNMTESIRNIEKTMSKEVFSKPSSLKKYRRSIVYSRDIEIGEIIQYSDIDFKRPGYGISPRLSSVLIGLELKKQVTRHDLVKWEDFKKKG